MEEIYIVVNDNPDEIFIEVSELGEKGDKGDQGIQGIKGDKGDKGDTGDAGADGNNNLYIQKTNPNVAGTWAWFELNNDNTLKTLWIHTD